MTSQARGSGRCASPPQQLDGGEGGKFHEGGCVLGGGGESRKGCVGSLSPRIAVIEGSMQ